MAIRFNLLPSNHRAVCLAIECHYSYAYRFGNFHFLKSWSDSAIIILLIHSVLNGLEKWGSNYWIRWGLYFSIDKPWNELRDAWWWLDCGYIVELSRFKRQQVQKRLHCRRIELMNTYLYSHAGEILRWISDIQRIDSIHFTFIRWMACAFEHFDNMNTYMEVKKDKIKICISSIDWMIFLFSCISFFA